ncbi:hypothetical protein LC608_04750 [Nostoc sp. XA010]|uniref:hypothetical protein n=1 Tax=Nostoc sp. XA010 TaxID=2780407 RepID=UPI001E4F92E2|nr:hypothetical protein [Nostoc sp. XA010]MCC5656304.1 hypothetical protein [Nostoc sp. XA010]
MHSTENRYIQLLYGLQLVRDRIGVRTLYYTTTGSVRWIAPQLKTLSFHRSFDLDLVALRDYLCCAFVQENERFENRCGNCNLERRK